MSIESGEIHAVVGENGAGKSTLMKIISGVIPPSEGAIFCDSLMVSFKTISDAEERGIFIIHQEPVFFSDLTVLENIFSGIIHKGIKLFAKGSACLGNRYHRGRGYF